MSLHPEFPTSPYAPLIPEQRWFPADEALRSTAYEKLLPPLVAKVRNEVFAWRRQRLRRRVAHLRGFASPLVRHRTPDRERRRLTLHLSLLLRPARSGRDRHLALRGPRRPRQIRSAPLRCLRRGVHRHVRRGLAALRRENGHRRRARPRCCPSSSRGASSTSSTKPTRRLSRNFLVIAPNIIVLDRLRADFDGLKIFFNDPVLPDNGHEGRNWRDDFQLTLHIQDEVRIVRPHRQPLPHQHPPRLPRRSAGAVAGGRRPARLLPRPVRRQARRQDHRQQNRPRRDHPRDSTSWPSSTTRPTTSTTRRMAWFKSIQDIHHQMLQKDRRLALQVDVTATPRHDNGAIFVQTVCDYPLVEAIHQNVVKHPVLPDAASRAKLTERKSALFTEKYDDYLAARHRGMEEELRRARAARQEGRAVRHGGRHPQLRRRRRLPRKICPELQGAVLVIHTKNNGEISEAASGKSKEELETAAQGSPTRSTPGSRPYKAIVSVLMLKEGWDVRNVTTSSACGPTSPRATSCPSKPSGAACAACISAASSAKPSPSWARPPSWSSSNPSRAKASPSSTCRWAAARRGRTR